MVIGTFLVSGLLLALGAAGVCFVARRKHIDIWAPAYVRSLLGRSTEAGAGPVHIILCVADHFEPGWNGATYEEECRRVETWVKHYPAMASKHRDADGFFPQHTFFYPAEQYRPEHLEALASLRHKGFGDVEIHLHHHGDTAEALRRKLVDFKKVLHEKHGLLHLNPQTGEIEYGFIHGNWALDNSARDGRYCGVNNELVVLRQTGCYADFTLPSAPEETQTRKINSIYYALDDPMRPKSHDTGKDVEVGSKAAGDLLIIQGPLALNWRSRKWGLLPRIENGDLSGDNPPTPERVDLWVRQHIHVRGRPKWVFVKLHAHGANERHMPVLLGKPMEDMLSYLEAAYNDGLQYCLHYVTAREMYNLIKSAEAGLGGNPHQFRQYRSQTFGLTAAQTC
jgi:hypothetical protein